MAWKLVSNGEDSQGTNPQPKRKWRVVDGNEGQPVEQPKMVDTILGKMPSDPLHPMIGGEKSFINPEMIKELIGGLAGGPGIQSMGAKLGAAVEPGIDVVGRAAPKIPLKDMWETLTKSIDSKNLARGVQKAHDLLEQKAKDIYKSVRGEATNRKIGNFEVPEDILKSVEKHLSSSAEDKALIEKVRNGDFQALRDLQSQLGEEGSSFLNSELASEKKIGREIMSTRKQINNAIEQNLEKGGNKDLAEQIKEANDLYSKKHDIYYSHPTIRRMVDKKKGRVIPRNAMNAFSEESDRIVPLHNAHPEVKSAVELQEKKNKIGKFLKIPGAAAAFGGGDALIHYLLNR